MNNFSPLRRVPSGRYCSWEDDGVKQKIILAILAMSNIRDGGEGLDRAARLNGEDKEIDLAFGELLEVRARLTGRPEGFALARGRYRDILRVAPNYAPARDALAGAQGELEKAHE
ncbi:MAG: hypothetical protein ACE5E0_01110 [Terriglobia bacterium]